MPGCGHDSGCQAVLGSRWSRWLGISVTIPATILYLCLITSALIQVFSRSGSARVVAGEMLLAAALCTGAAAIWFVLLQLLVLRRWCMYCLTLHCIGTLLCILAIWMRMRLTSARFQVTDRPAWAAGVMTVLFILGQLLVRPKLYTMSSTVDVNLRNEPPHEDSPPVSSRTASLSRTNATVTLMSGRISLAIADWPILGNPDAPFVIAYLFDYTCPTCRKGHHSIIEAVRRCGRTTAVLLVPAPVDPTCNPHITRHNATHAFACRFARLGLDLWRRQPQSFEEYDRWVFEPAEPPAIGLARAFAERITGLTDMDPSIPDGDLDKLIAQGVATYRASGADGMPTLLFQDAVLRGELPPADELAQIIREQASAIRFNSAVS